MSRRKTNLNPQSESRIHTLHDGNCNKDIDGRLQFDWSTFFGGPGRNYPPADEWNKKVLSELQATRAWIRSTKRLRGIHLSGHRRLSASVAIGSIFSAVSGFVIGIETKEGVWSTDSHPKGNTPDYSWATDFHEGESTGEMAMGIGIKKNIAGEVEQYLKTIGFLGSRLYLFGVDAILSAEQTNRAVDRAKTIILDTVSPREVKKILLFIATPAQFALFLGHRLNATCEIQCYERQQVNLYVPTCIIST